MNIQQAKEIIARFNQGKATVEEKLKLDNWYARENLRQMQNPEIEDYYRIRTELFAMLSRYSEHNKPVLKKAPISVTLFKKTYKYLTAAAAIAFIVFGVWLYFVSYKPTVNHNSQTVTQNDIRPGSNKATITLANGETINLSDNKTGVIVGSDLRYNDGSMVANFSPSGRDTKGREGSNNNNPLSLQGGSLLEGERSKLQMLTASTPRGGTYQITLPDGSKVWLNADSKISFPSQFSGKQRKVKLEGEAYFQVAKDKLHPFIVESKDQNIEVLGTHFNVNAYPDESAIKTTLLEGSVRIAFLSASHSYLSQGNMALARKGDENNSNIVLKPNQQSVLSGNKITVNNVVAEDAVAWKNGYFMFNSETLEGVMNRVSKWYNITVEYDDDEVRKKTMLGSVSRYENLSKVIHVLQRTGVAKFKIERNKITISKN